MSFFPKYLMMPNMFDEILSNMSDSVLITDDDGKFIYICPNCKVIFGYTDKELEEKENVASILDLDLSKVGNETNNIEATIIDKNRREHILLVNVKRVKIGDGTILFTCRDITEKKILEDEVARSEERFLTVIESAKDCIVWAEKGIIKGWNRSMELLTGMSKYQANNTKTADISLNVREMMALIEKSNDENRSLTEEITITSIDHLERNFICSVSRIRDSVLLIAKDITGIYDTKKRLKGGNAYIVNKDQLGQLVSADQRKLLITRDKELIVNLEKNKGSLALYVHENYIDRNIDENARLMDKIDIFLQEKGTVIMDCLEFLYVQSGFQSMMQMIYLIKDRLKDSVLIVAINKDAWTGQEIAIIKEECRELGDEHVKIYLDERKLEILRFILKQDSLHISVHFDRIRSRFQISKQLTKDLVEDLEKKGLVIIEEKGRKKNIYPTKKSISFLTE